MIYLGLSIVVSSLLFVAFKLLYVFKMDRLQAIIINYVIACSIGFFTSDVTIEFAKIPTQSWFFGAVFLGFMFIAIFNVMAITAHKNGLSVASISGKMSVVIPIVFGIIVYDESIGFIKVVGILLALLAVYLSSAKSDVSAVKIKNLMFPALLFLGSGIIDTSLKYMEKKYVSSSDVPLFLATIFGFSFVFGFLTLIFKHLKGNFDFQFKTLIGGVFLGIINYFSMEFLFKAFKSDIESSVLFTINNVGIVVVTTVFALLFFKEKLIKKNWIGLALALVSIFLVSFF